MENCRRIDYWGRLISWIFNALMLKLTFDDEAPFYIRRHEYKFVLDDSNSHRTFEHNRFREMTFNPNSTFPLLQ